MQHLPRVRDMMNADTFAVHATDEVTAAIDVLIDRAVTGVPVLDPEDRLVGMITEADCLALLTRGDADAKPVHGTVEQVLGKPFHTVAPEMDIYYVAGLFNKYPMERRFAVLEDGALLGVITRKDVLRGVRILLEAAR